MAQVNGSRFKILYPNWLKIKNINIPLPNGLLPSTVGWIRDFFNYHIGDISLDDIDRPIPLLPFYNDTNNCFLFKHADFYRHFKMTFGSTSLVDLSYVNTTDDSLYFYPIEIEGDRFRFLFEPNESEIKLNNLRGNIVVNKLTYRFIDTFDPRVLELINIGKVKIVISFMVDPCERVEFLNRAESALNEIGIDSKNIYILSGNIEQSYLGGMNLIDSIISLYQTSHTIPMYPFVTSLGYRSDYVKPIDLNPNFIRGKKLLSFNRNMNNPHRPALCYYAQKFNFLEDGYFSFLTNLNQGVENMLYDIVLDEDKNNSLEIKNSILNFIPYELDTQHVENKLGFTTNENNKKEYYVNSYFHLVTETEFTDHKTPFFSEKTWRPILNLQPFLFLGNPGSLKKLHSLGFKTFSHILDESYDEVISIKERFKIILLEIKRLNDMTFQEIHDLYYSCTNILIHNQNLLKSKIDHNPLREFLEYEFK